MIFLQRYLVRPRSQMFFPFFFQIGELQSVDGYMNIALEKTEEYVGGLLKHKYGDVFIRGNNGETQNNNFSPL